MYKWAIISYSKERIKAVGILQTFWYLYPITHSTPKLFTKKYPYPPEIHSISISIRVTHSMKGSNYGTFLQWADCGTFLYTVRGLWCIACSEHWTGCDVFLPGMRIAEPYKSGTAPAPTTITVPAQSKISRRLRMFIPIPYGRLWISIEHTNDFLLAWTTP